MTEERLALKIALIAGIILAIITYPLAWLVVSHVHVQCETCHVERS